MNDDWKKGEQDSLGLQAEWGCEANVRFPTSDQVTMYDSRGNPVYCACGKPAGCAMIGGESQQAWCSDCSPLHKYEAELIYKPPMDQERIKDEILKDCWVKNLKESM